MRAVEKKSRNYFTRAEPYQLAIVLIVLLLAGCSDKKSESNSGGLIPAGTASSHIYQNLAAYKDWQIFRQNNVIIIHPPNHLHQARFPELTKVFSALSRRTCEFLRIAPPDSLIFYFYTGTGHAHDVTGQSIPYSDGTAIHFWLPSFYGPPLVKHLLYKWESKLPKHEFLWHGIVALLDGSQQNYHQFTLEHIDSGIFVPLRELLVDTTIDVNRERLQSAEAASLVDYLVYIYGIEKVRELYLSDGDIYSDLKKVFNLPVDKIEKRWLEFIDTFVAEKKETEKRP